MPDTPGRPTIQDVQRLAIATRAAQARYPGPVGELVQREIWAYTDIGHRVGSSGGIVPPIIEELLDDLVTESGGAS